MTLRAEKRTSLLVSAFNFLELVYHTTVREVRTESGGAALGILLAMGKTIALIMMFYIFFTAFGLRSVLIRGDVFLFIMSGIFLFLVHNSAMSKTLAGGNMFHNMMQHAPMTPMIRILSSALAALYIQILAGAFVLVFVFLLRDNVEVYRPLGVVAPILLAWSSGVVTGLMFLLVKPFAPKIVTVLSTVYMRLMLFTSGKFFTANSLSSATLVYFDWNPLFHAIDQARGALFVNYVPRNSEISYAVEFVMAGLVLGMMGEFWLRRTVSSSTAKRNE